MPKRFTDSDKWRKSWFRKLTPEQKCFVLYLWDTCDRAGVWEVDFEEAEFYIGIDINNPEDFLPENFVIIKFDNDKKWFLPKFLNFQYESGLNSNKPAIISVRKLLKKHNLCEIVNEMLGGDYLIIDESLINNNAFIKDKDNRQRQEQKQRNEAKFSSPIETTTNTTKDTLVPKETITKQIVPSQIADKVILNVELNKIPDCLKGFTNWVFWKNIQKEDGKYTKIPYFDIGKCAKINDSATWRRFQDVAEWKSKGFSGIGFVLNKDDPFTFIDLDKCIENGKLSSFAQNVIDYFDSYTEISPSGTGLHIILVGKIEKAVKQVEIEIYDNLRYMACTGQIFLDRPVMKRQSKLNKTIEKYCKKKVKLKNNYIFSNNGKFTMPKEIFAEGMRNDKMAKWAGVLNKKDLGDTDYFGYLYQINRQCCSPPLLESEVDAIGKSIRRYK